MGRFHLCIAGSIALLVATAMCAAPGKPVAAPSPVTSDTCIECHKTFRDEKIVRRHAKEGQTCVDCHGPSKAHATGDKPRSKPDVFFAREKVAEFCGQCHDPSHHPQRKAKQFLDRWQGRPGPNGRMITAQSVCTDCHGKHIMPDVEMPAASG
jgi:hypothetical protein